MRLLFVLGCLVLAATCDLAQAAAQATAVETPRFLKIDSDSGVTFATDGSAWAILNDQPHLLNEWKKDKWIGHPFPAGLSSPQPRAMGDQEGRVWIIPSFDPSGIAYFDPRLGQWSAFADPMEAYRKLKANPPHFDLHKEYIGGPEYNSDQSRIAYRYGAAVLVYFDGAKNLRFFARDIMGKGGDGLGLGPPWFDKSGRLTVTLQNRQTWKRDEAGKWTQGPFESRFPEDIWSEQRYGSQGHPSAPEGSRANNVNSIALDNFGVSWMVWNGWLHKAIPGLDVIVGSDEPNPFRLNPQLREAHVDPDGNAFLQIVEGTLYWLIVRPIGPPSIASIAMQRTDEDSFDAALSTKPAGNRVYRWRLDKGPWALTHEDRVALPYLPSGPHHLEVMAFDEELNRTQNIATAQFEVHTDSAKQIARLVAALADPDFKKREAAVDALARQPALAVPALQKARLTADADVQWWIDAALQECASPHSSAK